VALTVKAIRTRAYNPKNPPSHPFWGMARTAKQKYVYAVVTLPPSVEKQRGVRAEECVNDAQKHLVFVVEDDDDVRVSTRALLEALGYAVRDFASGEDLIISGDAGTAGCIVLDYNLAGMSGLDLIRHLRGQGIQTPTIMVSGNGKQLIADAARAGVAAVLRKPLSAEALEQWLAQIFSASP
jgi:two-component system, LuxR family, response regulator FixJ